MKSIVRHALLALATILLYGHACAAQSLNLTVSPASVQPGATATVTFTWTDAATSINLAAIQWTPAFPSAVSQGAAALGSVSTATNKVLSCGPAACVLAGTGATLNATVMPSGTLITLPVTVAAGTAPGALSLALSGVQGASSAGLAVAITTAAATLTILSLYDLNGDGVVNSADVQIMLSADEGKSGCVAPLTGVGDGKCDASDVVLEILAALGVIH